MRISDWSSDVCSSDLDPVYVKTTCFDPFPFPDPPEALKARIRDLGERLDAQRKAVLEKHERLTMTGLYNVLEKVRAGAALTDRSEEHTSELQSLMRISYAVFCLKKKIKHNNTTQRHHTTTRESQ